MPILISNRLLRRKYVFNDERQHNIKMIMQISALLSVLIYDSFVRTNKIYLNLPINGMCTCAMLYTTSILSYKL